MKCFAISIIIAIPALSSAPSKVVPSVVTNLWPISSFKNGYSSSLNLYLSFKIMSPPSYESIICGLTFFPVISRAVSMWEIKPIVGTSFTVPSIEA